MIAGCIYKQALQYFIFSSCCFDCVIGMMYLILDLDMGISLICVTYGSVDSIQCFYLWWCGCLCTQTNPTISVLKIILVFTWCRASVL